MADQVEALRAGGSLVETIFPESSAEHLFGARAMGGSLHPSAAQAGFDQGRVRAERLIEFRR